MDNIGTTKKPPISRMSDSSLFMIGHQNLPDGLRKLQNGAILYWRWCSPAENGRKIEQGKSTTFMLEGLPQHLHYREVAPEVVSPFIMLTEFLLTSDTSNISRLKAEVLIKPNSYHYDDKSSFVWFQTFQSPRKTGWRSLLDRERQNIRHQITAASWKWSLSPWSHNQKQIASQFEKKKSSHL